MLEQAAYFTPQAVAIAAVTAPWNAMPRRKMVVPALWIPMRMFLLVNSSQNFQHFWFSGKQAKFTVCYQDSLSVFYYLVRSHLSWGVWTFTWLRICRQYDDDELWPAFGRKARGRGAEAGPGRGQYQVLSWTETRSASWQGWVAPGPGVGLRCACPPPNLGTKQGEMGSSHWPETLERQRAQVSAKG